MSCLIMLSYISVCCLLFGVVCLIFLFFFFKQKTAYEMRISDWSSDVCSSDLADVGLLPHFPQYESDGYGVGIAYKHVAGSYQLLIDNLLDLSHAPFVHKGLLGDRNTVANWDFSYDQRSEERRVGKECVSKCRSR